MAKRVGWYLTLIFWFFYGSLAWSSQTGFTQKDRELLIELRIRLQEMDKRFEAIDKRFEAIDKRFEAIDKRFELMDKRISELRMDMNKRFEQVDKHFEQIDKRFEQIDKRFEQIDKRFEEIITFMWMLVAIFTGITGVTISFALWDRRTMIRPFEDKVKQLEKEKLDKVIASLRKLAETDEKVAEVLNQFNL